MAWGKFDIIHLSAKANLWDLASASEFYLGFLCDLFQAFYGIVLKNYMQSYTIMAMLM